MLMLKLRRFPIIVVTRCKSTQMSLQTLPKHSPALLHNINIYIQQQQQQPAIIAAAKLHYSLAAKSSTLILLPTCLATDTLH